MFKYIVSAVLSFGTAAAGYSQEIPQEVKLPFGFTAHPALIYAGLGNMHLMIKDFDMALEDFRKASYYSEQCDADTADDVESLVLFGQTIAYDNLNDRPKCEQALSALILLSKEDGEECDEEEDEDDAFWDNFTLEKVDQGLSKIVSLGTQLYLAGEVLKMMKNLAMMAPSEDVRTTLLAIVNDQLNE